MKSGIYQIKQLGLLHRVQNWVAARFGLWYPSPVGLQRKSGPGDKLSVNCSPAMMMWIVALQVSHAAARALLRIGAVIFNIVGNGAWRKNKWPAQNYLPLWGPWKPAPRMQVVTCTGNLVKCTGKERHGWAEIEVLKPFSGAPPKISPRTHPWFFSWLFEVQIGTGLVRKGGLVWPLFSKTGKAWINKKLLVYVRPA